MDLSHRSRITSSQVIIHCYNVNPFAFKSVQIRREDSDKSFTLSRFHFCDLAFMKGNAANNLYMIRFLAVHSKSCFSRNSESFRKDSI